MLKSRQLLEAWNQKRISKREFIYAATVMTELQLMGEAVRLGKPMIERARDEMRMSGALAILGLQEAMLELYESDPGTFEVKVA